MPLSYLIQFFLALAFFWAMLEGYKRGSVVIILAAAILFAAGTLIGARHAH